MNKLSNSQQNFEQTSDNWDYSYSYHNTILYPFLSRFRLAKKDDFITYAIGVVLVISSIPLTYNKLKDKKDSYSKWILPRYFRKPVFKAKIVNEQKTFVLGTMILAFQSEYTGKLKNGYFMNEILLPENNRMNAFSQTIPHISQDGQNVMSFCNDIIKDTRSRKGLIKWMEKISVCLELEYT